MDSKQLQQTVRKRDGSLVTFDATKIRERLTLLRDDVQRFYISIRKSFEFSDEEIRQVVEKVQTNIRDQITTSEIDEIAASCIQEMFMNSYAPYFAGAVLISNFEKNHRQQDTFSRYVEFMYKSTHPKRNEPTPLISDEIYRLVKKKGAVLDRVIKLERNYLFTYDAFQKMFSGKYMLAQLQKYVDPKHPSNKVEYKLLPQENPQFMYLRMALGAFGHDLTMVYEMYDAISQHQLSPATPIFYAAGTPKPQMASCFLISSKEDSLDGIYEVFKIISAVAKNAGGAAVHWDNIRSSGSYISSTNGMSNGLVPMLGVSNAGARYVDQAGKRPGSQVHYFKMWHPDCLDAFASRRAHGATIVHPMVHQDVAPSKDSLEGSAYYNNLLFFGAMICDLFMERAEKAFSSSETVMWSFFDPADVRGLEDLYGDAYKAQYEAYEAKGIYQRQEDIRAVVKRLVQCIIETGLPYILFSDTINRKSQQMNVGVVKSSNLCAEIVEVSTPDETAVCNLSSICLPSCIIDGKFSFSDLERLTRLAVRMGNQVIDRNKYPTPCAERSNKRHRPLGIGVQGLADCFAMLDLAYDDPEAKQLNRDIAESMYFYALSESADLAEEYGCYPSMNENGGSPLRRGIFHWEMCANDTWVKSPADYRPNPKLNLNWESLRVRIRDGAGVYNSLLIAHMPTVSTSQITGLNESFEPFYAMAFCRSNTTADKYQVNRYLIRACQKAGVWSPEVLDQIQKSPWSIQKIQAIPENIRRVFRSYRDIGIKTITDMYTERCLFVDQSSSNNVYFRNSDDLAQQILEYLCYAWRKGLKTGSYYTRTVASDTATTFSQSALASNTSTAKNPEVVVSDADAPMCPIGCENCSA